MTEPTELPEPAPAPAKPLDDDTAALAVDEFSFLARDVNYDGVLSEDEFDEGRSLFDKLADPERFKRYDVNSDGSITREEFLAGRERDRLRELDELAKGSDAEA